MSSLVSFIENKKSLEFEFCSIPKDEVTMSFMAHPLENHGGVYSGELG